MYHKDYHVYVLCCWSFLHHYHLHSVSLLISSCKIILISLKNYKIFYISLKMNNIFKRCIDHILNYNIVIWQVKYLTFTHIMSKNYFQKPDTVLFCIVVLSTVSYICFVWIYGVYRHPVIVSYYVMQLLWPIVCKIWWHKTRVPALWPWPW